MSIVYINIFIVFYVYVLCRMIMDRYYNKTQIEINYFGQLNNMKMPLMIELKLMLLQGKIVLMGIQIFGTKNQSDEQRDKRNACNRQANLYQHKQHHAKF